MQDSVDISIVIRTLNEAQWMPKLLDAIGRQDLGGMKAEVIVVDSGSADQTCELAESNGCRMVSIEKSQFTFGRSLNYGCAAANGKWLVFISGHCIPVGRQWLKNLVSPLVRGECSYSYGRQVGIKGVTKFSENQLFDKYFPAMAHLQQGQFFCNNANSALSKEVWEENKFDEELTGLEDMELAKRLYLDGHNILYVTDAVVQHVHDESWDKIRRRYEREALALRGIMPEVTLGARDCIRYTLAGILFDFSAALRERCLHREMAGIIMFRLMQYIGTYRGNHLHREISRASKEKYFYPK